MRHDAQLDLRIIGAGDLLPAGAMKALARHGLRLGPECSVSSGRCSTAGRSRPAQSA
jgi:hypothetical protein